MPDLLHCEDSSLCLLSQNNVCEELWGFWVDPHHHVLWRPAGDCPPTGITCFFYFLLLRALERASQVAPAVKNPLANAGDVRDPDSIPRSGRSAGGGKSNHSNILAWRITWTEEPGGLQSMGSQRVRHNQTD